MQLNPEQAKRVAGALLRDHSWVAAKPGTDPSEWRAGQFSPGAFGRYRLVRLVGVGGMGEVYEAEQESPRRQVALKVVRPELLSTEAAARFEHEARILGRLQHAGIAQIYEAGRIESNGCLIPYFAMEFVAGRTLVEYADEQRLSTKARLELFLSVCDAVEHAHRKGVIHRDLKPGNILVDAAGHPRILDFGVARLVDADADGPTLMTDAGRLVGTLAYMSPEQVSGDREGLDTRSDVYALGVLLYQLLSGKLPYELTASHLPEAARIIKEREPAPMSTSNRMLRGDIETIVRKSLAKERERRYQSVGDLAADIRRYLRHAPIEAKPPSAMYQLRKFAVRNRGVVIATSLAVLAVLAGAAATGWLAWKQSGLIDQLTTAQTAEAEHRSFADAKRAEAERSSDTAWKVVEFVRSSLQSANPMENDSEYTVREFLESAAELLDEEPFSDPLTEAAIRLAVGGMYVSLGRDKEAVPHLKRAYEVRVVELGPQNMLTLDAMREYADALEGSGNADLAVKILDAALALAIEQTGPDTNIVLMMQREKAAALMRLGRFDESIDVARAALDRARASLGDVHATTLTIANQLGGSLQSAKRFTEARETWMFVRDGMTKKYGEDSMRAITVRTNLATLDMELQSYAAAEEQLRPLVAAIEKHAGPGSTYMLTIKHNLSQVLVKQRKFEEAEALAREVVEQRTSTVGRTHDKTMVARKGLTDVLIGAGRLDEAATEAELLLADSDATWGKSHPYTLIVLRQLARIVEAQGKLEQAESLMRDAWARATAGFGADHPLAIQIKERLGVTLYTAGRFEEAKVLFREALDTAQAIPNYDPRELGEFKLDYVSVLIVLGEYEAAELFLLGPERQLPADLKPETSTRDRYFIYKAMALYRAWGKPDQAAPYLERLEQARPGWAARIDMELMSLPASEVLARRGQPAGRPATARPTPGQPAPAKTAPVDGTSPAPTTSPAPATGPSEPRSPATSVVPDRTGDPK